VDRSDGREIIRIISAREADKYEQRTYANQFEEGALYEKRDRRLNNDPEAKPLPPERWANAMRRDEFFPPVKKLTTVRLDADVLEWLRSKGEGHLTRINEILRERMTTAEGGKTGKGTISGFCENPQLR
jgi:uncharacterized protein (DUF4415 family)